MPTEPVHATGGPPHDVPAVDDASEATDGTPNAATSAAPADATASGASSWSPADVPPTASARTATGSTGATGSSTADLTPDPGSGEGGSGGARADQTRTFGPRPPQAEPDTRRRRPWLPATLVAAAAVTILIYLALGPLRPEPDDDCPDGQRPFPEIGAQIVNGDPEGDGCETYGVYQLRTPARDRQDMFLTIRVDGERQRIRLGELGDRLFLGDWDCDGTDTPGVYRRRRGEVEYFDSWPGSRDEPYEPDRTEDVAARSQASLVEGEGGSGSGDEGETGGNEENADDAGSSPDGSSGRRGQEDANQDADQRAPRRRCDRLAVEET